MFRSRPQPCQRLARRPIASAAVRWRRLAPLLGAIALAGCGAPAFDSKRGASDQGGAIFGLWQGEVVAALVVGGLVWGLVVFAVLRYRRRGDDVPTQRQYVVPLEVTYTVVPILVVAAIFGFTYRTQRDVNDLAEDPDLVVDVRGFQWQWQFHYQDEDVTVTGLPDEPPVMVLPVGATVRLVLTSEDVIHSFYVPDFLYKRDAIPGVRNEIDVRVTDPGRYDGACAEFCGLDHARMTFVVEAVPRAEFDAWVDDHRDATRSRAVPGGRDGGAELAPGRRS